MNAVDGNTPIYEISISRSCINHIFEFENLRPVSEAMFSVLMNNTEYSDNLKLIFYLKSKSDKLLLVDDMIL